MNRAHPSLPYGANPAGAHAFESEYVRDQLVPRTLDVNGKTYHPDGEYVLYWMQSTHRLDENWALRAAIRTANRVQRPLVIHQGLDPTYPHASDRHHTFTSSCRGRATRHVTRRSWDCTTSSCCGRGATTTAACSIGSRRARTP